MLTDNDIKKIDDDSLSFMALSETLKEIITKSETPLTLGLYGEWGSGKTSLMRMTQDLLKKEDTLKSVWFDSWKYDKSHDLRVALIHSILREIENDQIDDTFKDKIVKIHKKVNYLGLGMNIANQFLLRPLNFKESSESLLKNPENINHETLELIGNFEKEFKAITKEYVGEGGKLVVFIDDLDRCIPEKAIDVLEAIKLFLNVKNTVFIIGADKQVIERGIIQKYGEEFNDWGKNYLDKIIQIPLILPPLREDIIKEQFIPKLNISNDLKQYASIIAEVGSNPRTIKRLLNQFELHTILADKRGLNVESKIMAKLTVIAFRYPDFYNELVFMYLENKTNLIRVLKNISEDLEKEKKLNEWKTLVKYIDDKNLMGFLNQEPYLEEVNLDHYVYLENTIELKKKVTSYFNIAQSFSEKGDHVNAIKNYNKALDINPNYVLALDNKAFSLAKLKLYDEAMECCEKAIKSDCNSAMPYDTKAFILGQLGQYHEAVNYCQKAIQRDGKNAFFWKNKGLYLRKLNKLEKSLDCYQHSIQLNPDNADTWNDKGFTLIILKKYKEAIKSLDKALKINPKHAFALNNKGAAFIGLNQHEKALEQINKSIDLKPQNPWAMNNKAVSLCHLGRRVDALKYSDEAIKIDSNFALAWKIKGDILELLERHEEAANAHEIAFELDPSLKES